MQIAFMQTNVQRGTLNQTPDSGSLKRSKSTKAARAAPQEVGEQSILCVQGGVLALKKDFREKPRGSILCPDGLVSANKSTFGKCQVGAMFVWELGATC